MELRPVYTRGQVYLGGGEGGFTLIEVMVAILLTTLIMGVAVTGVVEAQRGINTVVARATDANQVESVVSSLAEQVRQASGAAVYGCSSSATGEGCQQLWLYNPNPAPYWPYECTVWVYNAQTTPAELEAFATTGALGQTNPSISQIATANGVGVRVKVLGVAPASGLSDVFQVFTGYPGLVDINLSLQYATDAGQSSVQQASTPFELETEADDVNISDSSSLPALSSTNPSGSCY